jgi:seryl-tRNA synthetase
MYDIKWIREHPEVFKTGLDRRGLPAEEIYQKLLKLDQDRRGMETLAQQNKAKINKVSSEIGVAKKAGEVERVSRLMAEVSRLKSDVTDAAFQTGEKAAEELKKKLAEIPNLPALDVPDGSGAGGNVEHHVSGKRRDYAFKPKQHFELGEALGQMDFELAAKLSGARFVVLQKGLARMERALGQLFLDVHTSEKHGYTEVNPPLLVKDDVMFGTAQLPKFEVDQFSTIPRHSSQQERIELLERLKNEVDLESLIDDESLEASLLEQLEGQLDYEKEIENDRLWLIPTAEVPLTNLVRESIIEEDSLPRRYTACTPCFRAEAGAAGKDTRGMIRQHQFTKVELVSITTPEKSREEHERMLACAEEVLKKLDLHYRVVTLCTGDMGFAAQKTYDIEVWLPGQNMYREISSCSNCGEFQARRMNARYRGKDGKPAFVHTLNGSGVAVGRALIAVMETYQDDKGAIVVPEALKPYMGGVAKIERKAN